MDAALVGLIGVATGSVVGLLGTAVTARQQRRLEHDRLEAARRAEAIQVERTALLELVRLLATGTQAVAWLAWTASVSTADEIETEIATYDARMRELLPKLFAAEVAASSLSDEAFARMDPLVQQLLSLDTEIATASSRLESGSELACFLGRAISLSRLSVHETRAVLRDLQVAHRIA